MHMADSLLSPPVAGVMAAAAVGSIAYCASKIKKDGMEEEKVPVMGVMGAFVFAAQMINFTIPGTGSSGHIGGGILLAAILGPWPAFLAITAVLIIQCLFFADGGLMALGCNIINMGFFSCLLAYPLIFKKIVKKDMSTAKIFIASIVSVVVALQLGSFGVVIETLLSGITELPFSAFVVLMQPIHLAIGIVEGIVTASVLCFVRAMRPGLIDGSEKKEGKFSLKKTIAVLLIVTVIIGGGVSLLASAYPDGLEWSIEGVTGSTELESDGSIHEGAALAQEKTAIMPDYAFKYNDGPIGTSTAGVVGAAMTLVLAGATGFVITRIKKRKKQEG